MLVHALDLRNKIQYRLNFQNSNHQEIVGSEWVDKPEDLVEKLLYFSEHGYFCKIQKRGRIMSFDNFKQEFDETIGKMSEPELIKAMERAGCKFEDIDEASQTDYKNSLKNDY